MKDVDEEYKHLLGKEVKYDDFDGDINKIIPVGICRRKGITCVSADNTEYKVICLNVETYKNTAAIVSYDEAFDDIVKRLEEGVYEVSEARKFRVGGDSSNYSNPFDKLSACAFE